MTATPAPDTVADAGPPDRRPLELFELPLVFGQAPLLTANDFGRELDRRGLWPIHLGELEELHRTRLLQPLFRLVRDVRGANAVARREGRSPVDYLIYTPTAGWQLREYAQAGYLRDVRLEPFHPWRSYQRSLGEFRYRTSEFLYSRYQLLVSARRLRDVVRRMRGRRNPGGDIQYRLRPLPWDQAANDPSEDRLVVMLSAVEARYRPEITLRVALGEGGPEAWDRFEQSFDPAALLAWLRLTPDQVFRAAEQLFSGADFMDPLGDWWQLIRFGRRDRWDRLKHEALLALDHRIAAEMLLRFHEDLAAASLAPAIEPPHPRYDDPRHRRIPKGDTALEAAVTDFGLSPHPALILVLEGETEMVLVPRALDTFLPRWRTRVRLVNAKGVDANLDLLAAYAGGLELGQEHEDIVLLSRPYTRLMVAFDPEGSFATEQQRQEKRERWAARMQESLQEPCRTSPLVLQQLIELIHVETWGAAFEFAHFTDGELARAANRVAKRSNPAAPRILVRSIAPVRAHDGDLGQVWHRAVYKGVSKPAVAEEFWPMLERKLREANKAGDITTVPLGRVLVRVAQLASVPRHGWALQTRESGANAS